MPGICGILNRSGKLDVAAQLASMMRILRRDDWYVQHEYVDAGANLAIGRVSLGFVNGQPQPAASDDGSVQLVMDGELYDAPQVRAALAAEQNGEPVGNASHAELLLAGYRRQGRDFFRKLHGSFSVAIWDASRRRLILTGDRFGMRPLYFAKLGDRLVFASSLQAVLRDPDLSNETNPRGLAQFFSFGQYFCNDTSVAGVEVAPAAAWICIDAETGRISVDRYYDLHAEAATQPADASGVLDALDEQLHAAVARRLQETDHIGLALSGGLDARTILGMIDQTEHPVRTISYGIPGCLDHRCAARMSKLVGAQHTAHMLDADFLANYARHLETMVQLTGGQYLSQCIILPTLPLYRKLGIEALIRGHAGELMHMHKAYAYSLDERALEIRSDAELEAWLIEHLQGYMLEGVESPLFRGLDAAEVRRLALESLREALEPVRGIEPPVQRVWHLFLSQRLRRETTLSLAKFGTVAEVRVPYLDNDLVETLLAAPPELKLGETIQTHILQKRRPEFLRIVNANTGTRVGAGPLRRKLSTLRLRVLAKLGVPGYQPYERLGLWLRRELAPLVEDVLLGERCLDRGIFMPDTVRRVISDHASQRENHTYLLMAMLIFELGQRLLSDGRISFEGVLPTAASHDR